MCTCVHVVCTRVCTRVHVMYVIIFYYFVTQNNTMYVVLCTVFNEQTDTL